MVLTLNSFFSCAIFTPQERSDITFTAIVGQFDATTDAYLVRIFYPPVLFGLICEYLEMINMLLKEHTSDTSPPRILPIWQPLRP